MTMIPKKRVLITGAAGALGSQLRKRIAELGIAPVLSDRVPPADGAAGEDFRICDLADLPAVRQLVEGVDAIVHLGGEGLETTFERIVQSNIVGCYNIYEAARKAGIRRVVYVSSIHAVGFRERSETIDADDPPRPDSLYGVSKTFGENLSRYYFDKFGIESVCLRVGSCFPKPTDRRQLITWLSYRDFCQLIRLSLDAPRVGHMICFATSNNRESFWDNRLASVLGYRPMDSADDYRDEVMRSTPQGDPNDPAVRYQGGSFAAAGHYEDNH
jgi:uronate dehydrogenase